MAKKIVAVIGSYRRGGITAQAVNEAAAAAREAGAEVELIDLLDKRIEFCTNCRACTQAPGVKRGECVLSDDMAGILDKLDAADGLILAAPVNYFNVTALARRFLERMIVYDYWPWGAVAPKLRINKPSKKAVLITSSAMPSLIGRLFTGALRALNYAAASVGAKKAGTLLVGIASLDEKQTLTEKERRKARALGRLL
ncbi:MAG: flavodoxin family protein [Elusimicrobia bacterium]|nr:flavodoxin family protein [Elusimicrobiota bacterium]